MDALSLIEAENRGCSEMRRNSFGCRAEYLKGILDDTIDEMGKESSFILKH